MMILQWIFLIIVLGCGIALMILTHRRSKIMFFGKETSLLKAIGMSALSGLSVSLLFMGISLLIGILNSNYRWTSSGIITIVTLGLILGVIATVGSLWQSYIIGKFRKYLYQKLNRDKKD